MFGSTIRLNGLHGKNDWPHIMRVYLLFYIFPFKHKRIQKGQKRKIQTRISVWCKREILHIVKKMFIVYYHQNQSWMHFLFTIFFQYHILLASEWPKFFSLIIKTLSFFTNVGIRNKKRNFNLYYKVGTIFNQMF